MIERIIVTKEQFDASHYMIFFSIDNEDIGFRLHIAEFNKEMEYLHYDCKVKVVNGRTGFIFSNTIPVEEIIFEAKRFISQYKLDY